MKNKWLFAGIAVFILSRCGNEAFPVKYEDKVELAWNKLKSSPDLDFYKVNEFIETYPEFDRFDSALFLYEEVKRRNATVPPPWNCSGICSQVVVLDSVLYFNEKKVQLAELPSLTFEFLNISRNDSLSDKHLYELAYCNDTKIKPTRFELVYEEETMRLLQPVVVALRSGVNRFKNGLVTRLPNPSPNCLGEIDSLFARRILLTKAIKFEREVNEILLEQKKGAN